MLNADVQPFAYCLIEIHTNALKIELIMWEPTVTLIFGAHFFNCCMYIEIRTKGHIPKSNFLMSGKFE